MTTRTAAGRDPELVEVPERRFLMATTSSACTCRPWSTPRRATATTRTRRRTGRRRSGSVAWTVHRGPFDEIGPASHTVAGWIQEHGHEVAGPPRRST
jgi:hypothetical protein